MKMYLKDGDVARLVSMRKITSKNGNDCYFISVANTRTFESGEFMLDAVECDPTALYVGSDYQLVIDLGARFTSALLYPLKK